MKEILKITHLKKYYGSKNNITKAINDLSFTINEQEFVAIMGASGSGKSTLLNCISTIDRVTSGNIYVDNLDITEVKEDELALFPKKKFGIYLSRFQFIRYPNN